MRRLRVPAAPILALLLITLHPIRTDAVTCHCFRDRTFDPSRPGKIDPYLLATTQNSFFSAVFGLPKKAVVRAKMSGVSGSDLWIAYYVAARLGQRAGDLMASRRSAPSWPAVLDSHSLSLAPLGERFSSSLRAGGDPEALAAVAAAEMLARRLGADRAGLDRMLARGGSSAEIIAATLLARWTGERAAELFADVKSGLKNWGSLMNRAGIAPSDIEGRIRRLLVTEKKAP